MAVKSPNALEAMQKARLMLTIKQPFFGCLALQLQLVEVTDENQVDTMAVDGKNLYYHPPFALGLSDAEIQGVVAHEVMHCAYRHFTRRQQRDHKGFNIAGDFVINADLKKAGFTLPGNPIGMDTKLSKGMKGHLYDPQFDGMGTEEVYERIQNMAKKMKVEMLGENDPGGCGAVLDAKSGSGNKPGEGDQLSTADANQLDNDWDQNVRLAVQVARAKEAGSIPGHLARLVEEINKPKINWRDVLRDFISNSMSKDYSWSRPNRRSVACGCILPGFIPDAMQHLVVVLDCSGSIGQKEMQIYADEAGGALNDGVCDRMTVVYTDTIVHGTEEFLKGDLIKIKAPDGGGTCFNAVMDWIPQNVPDAGAIVFLTDMMTMSFGQDPDIPVLWGATLPESQLRDIHPPFGRVLHVSD